MSNARVSSAKMAENDIDLYAEDIDQDFAQVNDFCVFYEYIQFTKITKRRSFLSAFIQIYKCINKQLYSNKHFQDDFGGDNVDLYDDVIAAPPATNPDGDDANHQPNADGGNDQPGSFTGAQVTVVNTPNASGRRHQLYVGNLTWVSFKNKL